MLKKFHEAALDEIYVPGSNEEVFNGRLLKVQRDHVTLPNGNDTTREYIRHPGAVAIVPVLADGSVVLVKQCRYPLGTLLWEIPAGKLDSKAEDRASAALRELREETGFRCGKLTFLGNIYTSPAILDEVIGLYLAEDLVPGDTHPDEDEFLAPVGVPLEQLVDDVMAGRIPDAKTQLAVMRIAELLRRRKEGTND